MGSSYTNDITHVFNFIVASKCPFIDRIIVLSTIGISGAIIDVV